MRFLVLVAMAAVIAATPCIAAGLPEIGCALPDLSLPNIDNKIVNISELSGKPTVIAFFTSWSKPCVKEIEYLQGIYGEYSEKGLNVIGVSFDKKVKQLLEFKEEIGIKFEVLIDKKLRSLDKYAILVIPTTILVDKSGNISNIFVDYDENAAQAIKEFAEAQTAK